MTEELQKEMEELKALGYRIRNKQIKYIYNHNEIVGKKIIFEIEKKMKEKPYCKKCGKEVIENEYLADGKCKRCRGF